jgi:hypothetical protein
MQTDTAKDFTKVTADSWSFVSIYCWLDGDWWHVRLGIVGHLKVVDLVRWNNEPTLMLLLKFSFHNLYS